MTLNVFLLILYISHLIIKTSVILCYKKYEYDQASEQFTGHDWQKSEEFMWDLERDRKKLYYKS